MRITIHVVAVVVGVVGVVVVAAGCQKQLTATADPQQPYTASRTTVIGTDSGGNTVDGSTNEAVAPGDCIDVGAQCVDTTAPAGGSQFCKGGPSGGPVDSIVVDGDNDVFTAGDVFGDVNVTKNNVVLVSNRVQGAFNAVGGNANCVDNKSFTDANHDDDVQTSEVGVSLSCGG